MAQNRFAEVLSKNDFLNYGPERIDVHRLSKKINESNWKDFHSELQERIQNIQAHLKKLKLLDKNFPEIDLTFKLDCHNRDELIDKLKASPIQDYNALLCSREAITFAFDCNSHFSQPQSGKSLKFRKAYVQYLHDNFEAWPSTNSSGQKADLKALLNQWRPVDIYGKSYTGYELYQKALKEEMDSIEFQRGVFLESINTYQTDVAVDKKPILCLLGPSGSGKSFSRDSFFRTRYPSGEKNQLLVVSVDNGIPRQCSKILSITKQVMEAKGITINDLDKSSKHIYQSVKKKLCEWALSVSNMPTGVQVGLFIPETFAAVKITKPRLPNFFKSNPAQSYLELLGLKRDDLDKADFHLGKITHQNPKIFQSIVKTMAEKRAHPTAKELADKLGNKEPFNFHTPKLKEYKKYSASEFLYSTLHWSPSFTRGMKKADEVTRDFKKSGLPIKQCDITNDLILLIMDNGKWRECTEKETFEYSNKHLTLTDDEAEKYQIVSKSVWEQWLTHHPEKDLITFINQNPKNANKIMFSYENESMTPERRPLYQNQRSVKPQSTLQTETEDLENLLNRVTDSGRLALALYCLVDPSPSIQNILPQFYGLANENSDTIKRMNVDRIECSDSDSLKAYLEENDPALLEVLDRIQLFNP